MRIVASRHPFSLKEPGIFGGKAGSRFGAGNVKDEPGTSFHVEQKKVTEDY